MGYHKRMSEEEQMSANAYKLTHNEIAANIEKCQKLSEARWNDQLIEYICNH